MNSVGTSIVGAGVVAVNSQFLSKLRYQFRRTRESAPGELGDVVVHLFLGDPARAAVRFRQPIDEALRTWRRHLHEDVLVVGRARPADQPAHGARWVTAEFGVGDAGLLEVEDVEEVLAEGARARPPWAAPAGAGWAAR